MFSLSTYDYSKLYTILHHNLILSSNQWTKLIEFSKGKVLFILHVVIGMLSLRLIHSEIMIYGLVRKCVNLSLRQYLHKNWI